MMRDILALQKNNYDVTVIDMLNVIAKPAKSFRKLFKLKMHQL